MIIQMHHKEEGVTLIEISTFSQNLSTDLSIICVARQTGKYVTFDAEKMAEFSHVNVRADNGEHIHHAKVPKKKKRQRKHLSHGSP